MKTTLLSWSLLCSALVLLCSAGPATAGSHRGWIGGRCAWIWKDHKHLVNLIEKSCFNNDLRCDVYYDGCNGEYGYVIAEMKGETKDINHVIDWMNDVSHEERYR